MLFKGYLSSFVLDFVSLQGGDSFIIGTEVMLKQLFLAASLNEA
jgi:hypothetical protein